jgi:hypothetical protein
VSATSGPQAAELRIQTEDADTRYTAEALLGVFIGGKRLAKQQIAERQKLIPLRRAARFHALLRLLKDVEWVVYAKPPFGGPKQVLKYLARYTHRVGCEVETGG